MTKRSLFVAGFTTRFCNAMFGQALPGPTAFEVASVKRDVSGGKGGGTRLSRGGIFTATNSTLQALMRYAWGVKDFQIQGPNWMGTERYDIEARAGGKPADSTAMASTTHSIVANKITLQILATLLASQMDRPVLDSTGLQGTYDVSLEWTPETASADSLPTGPSVFAALQEQLGLKLESQTGPVEILIVDRADRIPTEN